MTQQLRTFVIPISSFGSSMVRLAALTPPDTLDPRYAPPYG
jgi:hypothetical protein